MKSSMFKPSSRGQRSRGVKVKHVLQICLLLGVCFWLIYQVKHSHDKRKEFDEKDAKISITVRDSSNVILGRKGLDPIKEQITKSGTHQEEEDEEDVRNEEEEENKHLGKEGNKYEEREEEENKNEEEEQDGKDKNGDLEYERRTQEEDDKLLTEEEQGEYNLDKMNETKESKHEGEEEQDGMDKKNGDTEDEGRGGNGDELDEHDEERKEGETDREEDFIDEEKEREEEDNEEADGKENEEKEREEEDNEETDRKENEEREDDFDNEHSESQDRDGDDRYTNEAREENYKADDASSEVTHDTQIENNDAEKVVLDNSNGNGERTTLAQDHKSNDAAVSFNQSISEVKVGEDVVMGNNSSFDMLSEPINNDTSSPIPGNSSLSNSNVRSEEKNEMISHSTSGNSSLANSAVTARLIQLPEARSSSEKVSTGASNNSSSTNTGDSQLTATKTLSVASSEMNARLGGSTGGENPELIPVEQEVTNNKNRTSDSNQSVSNSTTVTRTESDMGTYLEPPGSSTGKESSMLEKITSPATTVKVVNGSYSTTTGDADVLLNKESDINGESLETNESEDSSSAKFTDKTLRDPIDSSDSSVSENEKEVQKTLETLPEAEGNDKDNVAAE